LSGMLLGPGILDFLGTPTWRWSGMPVLQASTIPAAAPAQGNAPQVQFVDVAREAGLTTPNVWGGVDDKNYIIEAKGSGIAFFDYDQDGWLDIYLTNGTRLNTDWPPGHAPTTQLYHSNRDGTFTDVTKKAGLWKDEVRWGAGCTWLDYDRDGFLDLFVANYIMLDISKVPAPGQTMYCQYKGVPVMCGPRGLPAGTNILYHNNGDGTFSDVSEKA